ncbi:MAG: bifunctional diaminohydroxyphosphoribosylaminopyrimidine deaminase/5-amino-6-(5-phosphoribosylamino)uracil reductase RibD [Natronospirillum sp.]|uniref:bifunctional diaminohydroxyphosphoribosylaminopyrimidine deaminase/5-amino-6-(5-phosphoribosylamino)uracil reductase RibD n=1 Tax=Natronospirillum sp. TaxID=2812955 RepID=UPI0026006CAA|nr:bifunctional diaminohydroxyphosphoribosylaminopyrimidine deaminase/5-amino-6-(5-phosphoribosylamino)uracil reductase RibD [Natronospirillum sp.]MCH8550569.1 bifunctional diaminohydroxyphosphoribosylaminopyrimidine deaminase/5-amino-6-(5-phosphoribosylamino)uracil reductase RibD [Natronospirillum sp.]
MMAGQDEHWMQRAIRLAERGLFSAAPNPRVGCTIVKSGVEIGSGWHPGTGEPHAEVFALREAGKAARGATAYVNLEPCSHFGRTPPCADALLEAGVARVVVGHIDPNPQVAGQGIERLRAAGVAVTVGVLEEACDALNKGFFKRMQQGVPWVRVKIAHSLDGRTAMASGESQWITGEEARADVQYWRARSCAVLTGADTLLHDQARLKVRRDLLVRRWPEHPPVENPLRILIDSQLRVSPDHPFFSDLSDVMVCTSADQEGDALAALHHRGIPVLCLPRRGDHLDLNELLQALGERGINELMVESGPRLSGAFIQQQLVDELVLYCAPRWLGSKGLPVVDLPLTRMAKSVLLDVQDQRQFGADWRIIAVPEYTTESAL